MKGGTVSGLSFKIIIIIKIITEIQLKTDNFLWKSEKYLIICFSNVKIKNPKIIESIT